MQFIMSNELNSKQLTQDKITNENPDMIEIRKKIEESRQKSAK